MGARFSAPVQTGPGAHRASYTMGTGSFPRVKRPGRGVDHPPAPSAEVKERVELLWAFVSCSRVSHTKCSRLGDLASGICAPLFKEKEMKLCYCAFMSDYRPNKFVNRRWTVINENVKCVQSFEMIRST